MKCLSSKKYTNFTKFFIDILNYSQRKTNTLWEANARCILYTLELLLAAGGAPRIEKQTFIKKANIKFDTFKIFIRIANDVKMIDDKKYLTLQKQIQEIGRMIGGWQRSLY